jgi:hypothetical protein
MPEDVIRLLEKTWGPGIPFYIGSPHEGDKELDLAEVALHELAHQTLLFPPGRMGGASEGVLDNWINELPPYQRDLHEIRALAIELLAARRLLLPLNEELVIGSGRKNTCLFRDQRNRLRSCIHGAMRSATNRARATSIVH